MSKPDSQYPEDWKIAARKDWHRHVVLLEDGDAEGAAFFIQQSIEKYLKAFLIEKNWKLKKIHELDTLLDYAVDFDSSLEKFRVLCERATGYYFTERYPILVPSGLTEKDIIADRKEAVKLIEALFGDEEIET